MISIGWFSTGRDKAARELLELVVKGILSGELPLRIAFVFCNREKGEDPESDEFIRQVRDCNLPLVSFSSTRFQPELRRRGLAGDESLLIEWRTAYHAEVLKLLSAYPVAFSFLAGYMLIVSAEMCTRQVMLNLHPALPGGPKGTWQEVVWQLIEHRAKEAGAMIHLVTPELDAGPPVTYCRFSLSTLEFQPYWAEMEQKLRDKSIAQIRAEEGEQNSLFQAIRREEFTRELPLIWLTLHKLAHGIIQVKDGKVFLAGKPVPGLDISAEVGRQILEVGG